MAQTSRKARKGYFYETEEQAVVDFLNAKTKSEKDRIFQTYLHAPFTKMIESIIHRYKLYPPDRDVEQTFHDTMSFLMTKIDRYDPAKNFKAYSYCGTVCKNYLIHEIEKAVKLQKRIMSYDGYPEGVLDSITGSRQSDRNEQEIKFLNALMRSVSMKYRNLIERKEECKLKENEVKVGMALIKTLENWEELFLTATDSSNKFNKSSILLHLREVTGLSTKEIRESMKRFKLIYYDTKKVLVEEGLPLDNGAFLEAI